MRRTGLKPRLLALLLVFNLVGCSSFRTKTNDSFVKPLGGSLSGHSGGNILAGQPEERTLCLKTAASVAAEGHATEAILLYEKAESLGQASDTLDTALAPLYAQVGKTAEAVARYQRVIESGAATPETYNNLTWTYIDASQYAEAAASVDMGLVAFPENERLRASSAVIAYKLDDREASLKQFAELYGPAAAHHNLAVLDVEHGRLEQAEDQLIKAAQSPNCLPQSLALRETLHAEIAKLDP